MASRKIGRKNGSSLEPNIEPRRIAPKTGLFSARRKRVSWYVFIVIAATLWFGTS